MFKVANWRTIALYVASVSFLCGCGVESTTAQPIGSAATSLACVSPSTVVAAFWASDDDSGGSKFSSGQTTGGNVWLMGVDESLKQLTSGGTTADPWIGDDAGSVYFTRTGSADPRHAYEVWKSDLLTGEETMLYQLSEHPGQVLSPEASPTGDSVAFAMAAGDDLRTRIVVLRIADGTLTQYSAPDQGDFFLDVEPTYSHDGERIAYVRFVSTGGEPASSLHVVDLRTRRDSEVFTVTGDLTLHSPEWSPDGTSLLIVQVGGRSDGDVSGQALSIEPSTGEATVVADNVVDEATYSSLRGTELSAVGLTREQLVDEEQNHDASLITWRDGEISLAPLPTPLAFAQNLTIARCSLDTGGFSQ